MRHQCWHPKVELLTFCVRVMCRYRNAELQNGRWAMMACAGILIPAVRL
jgi:hypothetical protein